MLKVFADLKSTAKLSCDLDLVGVSSSFARGNENNQDQADGTYYLGPGAAPGYAIVNLGARFQVNRWLQVIAQINNVFDRHYYTTAQLGPAGFTDAGTFIARPFPAVNGEFPVQQATFFTPGGPRPRSGSAPFQVLSLALRPPRPRHRKCFRHVWDAPLRAARSSANR